MPEDTMAETAVDGDSPSIDALSEDVHLLKKAKFWTDRMSVRAKTYMRDHLDYEIREGIGA